LLFLSITLSCGCNIHSLPPLESPSPAIPVSSIPSNAEPAIALPNPSAINTPLAALNPAFKLSALGFPNSAMYAFKNASDNSIALFCLSSFLACSSFAFSAFANLSCSNSNVFSNPCSALFCCVAIASVLSDISSSI